MASNTMFKLLSFLHLFQKQAHYKSVMMMTDKLPKSIDLAKSPRPHHSDVAVICC